MATKPKLPKANPQIALAISMAAFALIHFFPEAVQHRIYLTLGAIVAGVFCLGFVLARFRKRKDPKSPDALASVRNDNEQTDIDNLGR